MSRRRRGGVKGERQIYTVISSLSVLHSLECSKRLTELGREEKGEGGDRGDLGEKKESTPAHKVVCCVPVNVVINYKVDHTTVL